METETKKASGKKVALYVLIGIVLAFIIYYTIMMMMSPGRELENLKEMYKVVSDKKNPVDEKIYSDSTYLKLLKDKAYLQSHVAMAETDSIYLTIDLADSIANIEISGVVVHTAKISEFSMSSILEKGDENLILSMLSSPFVISNSISTIKKEPVLVKIAPKDTSEYKPDIMPDTSITEPVNYILEMTNGTRLYIYEEENARSGDRKNQFFFDLKDKLRNAISAMKKVAVFKVPEYHPYIKLKLPRADAKIIYRAIPRNGQIAVFR
jgi:hypothetical protein